MNSCAVVVRNIYVLHARKYFANYVYDQMCYCIIKALDSICRPWPIVCMSVYQLQPLNAVIYLAITMSWLQYSVVIILHVT